MLAKDEKLYAMLTMIGSVILTYLGAGLGGLLLPFVMYLMYKDRSRFVAYYSLQATYFGLLVFVLSLAMIPLVMVLIGIPLLIALGVAHLVFLVIAAIQANDGRIYELPVVGRMARNTTGPYPL